VDRIRLRRAGSVTQVLSATRAALATALLVASAAHATDTDDSAAAGSSRPDRARPPQYEVVRISSQRAAALLSGGRDAWSAATRIGWGEAENGTSFRALASAQALFVRFDVVDAQPWSTLTRRDDPLWREEVVEIFIAPADAAGQYVEIQINPENVVADLWIDLSRRSFDTRWNFTGLETHVLPHADEQGRATGWTAIARLPWAGFQRASGATLEAHASPASGERWRFNVFRIERPGGRHRPDAGALFLAWSPTGSSSFHVPDAFGDLVFR
jgi:Carbohydrate family 9 binding domain-like